MVLWALIALLLIRGAADVLAKESPATVRRPVARPATTWPDDRARAFAVGFARAYLTYDPRRPLSYQRGVARFMTPELVDATVPQFADRSDGQAVEQATVTAVEVADRDQAMVTVAVELKAGGRTSMTQPTRSQPPRAT